MSIKTLLIPLFAIVFVTSLTLEAVLKAVLRIKSNQMPQGN